VDATCIEYTSTADQLYAWTAGEGPSFIFFHGGLGTHNPVLQITGPLTDEFTIVAPDVRGHGRSVCREVAKHSFAQYVDDAVALMDELEIEDAVVGGESIGSGIAIGLALAHPARVRGLVVITPPYAGEARGYFDDMQDLAFSMLKAAGESVAEKGIAAFDPLLAVMPPAVQPRAAAMIQEHDLESVGAAYRAQYGLQPFAGETDLQALNQPVLLVPGRDVVHPSGVSDLYAETLPNVTVSDVQPVVDPDDASACAPMIAAIRQFLTTV